ncbi:MAG: hypothetical protein Q9219_000314 [cf. Caloplaca sp. 3 TL-2023]
MDLEDGQMFVKKLAYFVRSHERALANALQLRQRGFSTGMNGAENPRVSSFPSITALPINSPSSFSNALTSALSIGSLGFTSHNVKAAKLSLTSHHLFYLLSRFEELDITVGPLNVRTESLHAETSPANYVSFLSQSQGSHGRNDRDSIYSVTSVRSVLSGISALWSGFGSSNNTMKAEKARAQFILDLKYLYSAFTKIPCLRLAPNHDTRLIRGYEEFPFDTAVPLHVFKNLSALEICDVDFRRFFGWDKLAEQLRSLTLKRASIDNALDLLISIVVDDMDRRRRRSSQTQRSPLLARPSSSPIRLLDVEKAGSVQGSPIVGVVPAQSTSPQHEYMLAKRVRSSSPNYSTKSRHSTSLHPIANNRGMVMRSGSASSDSSTLSNSLSEGAYRVSSLSHPLPVGSLPSSKWRFLRHLGLADNALTAIPADSLVPLADCLCSLDLSCNLFTEVPDGVGSLTGLRALNLSNCMVGSLQSLIRHPIPAIAVLNLRANRLESIIGVETLLSLERLDLRGNQIKNPSEFARLTDLPDFGELWIAQNPFTKNHKDHRITIFNLFRSTPGLTDDILIDSLGPSYNERKQLVDRVAENEPNSIMQSTSTKAHLPQAPTNVHLKPSRSNAGVHIATTPSIDPVPDESDSVLTVICPSSSKDLRRAATKPSCIRKEARRPRVVDVATSRDLALSEAMPSSGLKLSSENNPFSSVGYLDRSGRQAQATRDDKLSLSHTQLMTPSSLNPHEPLPSDKLQKKKFRTQVYRQRIEALKQEVGSNWLSAFT